MNEYKTLISGSYNVFNEGWNGCGVYAVSGLYQPQTFTFALYIGSAKDLQHRIEEDHIWGLERNKHPHNAPLQCAWNKHGKDAFIWLLLEQSAPETRLIAEQKYLDLYHPFVDEFRGYNISHSTTYLRESPLSEETKRKISENKRIVQLGKNNSFYGKHHTNESKDKMRQKLKGKPNLAIAKRIKCIETNRIYESGRAAAKELQISFGYISGVLRGRWKTAKGLHFEYA